MLPPSFDHVLDQELGRRRLADQWRSRVVVQPLDATHVQIDGRRFTNFSSNNYLGLTHHPLVIRALTAATQSDGAGAGAAGLITGYTTQHAHAEDALALWKGTETALILPSGYQANHAAIQTLAALGKSHAGGLRFLIDKLCHASLIDAVMTGEMPWRVYPHNGYGKLQRLLADAPAEQLQVVVTESIFSMDGDAADLPALAALKKSHPFFLLLDEAHASGVFGPGGRGYAAELGLQNAVDATVITLSKAMGCMGGAICGSSKFRDGIINFGRAYIFSTSVAPGIAAAAAAAIQVMQNEPQRQQHVRQLAMNVRKRLRQSRLIQSSDENNAPQDSPIIPIIFGAESAALKAAGRLREAGLLVMAVRPPTVAKGTSRLRLTLCCEHSDAEVDQLLRELELIAAMNKR